MNSAWFALYPGDYGRKTAHLSVVENGAYFLLLNHYYATGRPLPKDRAALYRIVRAHDQVERAAVDSVVSQFFVLQDDGYHNGRADVELGKRAEFHQKLSAAGRKRWHQPGRQAGSTQAVSRAIARPQPQQQPEKETSETTPAPETGALPLMPVPTLADWIPIDAWASYMKLRKEKRAKVTPDAVDLLIRKLAAWRAEGQDVREILERSVMNGWTGIFPIEKEKTGGKVPTRKSTAGGFTRTLQAAQRVWGNDSRMDSEVRSELPTGA